MRNAATGIHSSRTRAGKAVTRTIVYGTAGCPGDTLATSVRIDGHVPYSLARVDYRACTVPGCTRGTLDKNRRGRLLPGVAAAYALPGGTFLIIKTRGALQAISRSRSRCTAWIMLVTAAYVTVATPRSRSESDPVSGLPDGEDARHRHLHFKAVR